MNKPSPNFDNLRRTLLRDGPPGPVPFLELAADPGAMESVLGKKFPVDLRELLDDSGKEMDIDKLLGAKQVLDMMIEFFLKAGYDYVFTYTGLVFPRDNFLTAQDTAGMKNWGGGQRYWQDEEKGPIQSWEDFEKYPWPEASTIPYTAIDYLNAVVPDGMKISVNIFGVFESASWLMGLQPFSYALYEQPDLVQAIVDRVGELTLAAVRTAASYDNVGIVFFGDDLGHTGGTLVSPKTIRQLFFPYHRKIAEAVHAAGKVAPFHSCGNVSAVMEDIIDNGFDAKHAYEDKILSAEDAYRQWGDRISIVGGLDMDFIARGSPEDVRLRTRGVLDACAAKGTGFALGTGNSVANYIPPQNYLAMLDEGRRWNREHYG